MRRRLEHNIVVYDIPGDTYPVKYVEDLLDSYGVAFSLFFYQAVLLPAQEYLYKQYTDTFKRDNDGYNEYYMGMLGSDMLRSDGRTSRAVDNELDILRLCIDEDRQRVDFLDITNPGMARSRKTHSDREHVPIRIQLDIRDKLDLRVVSASHEMALWQYIGEMLTVGILKMFIARHTSPQEKAMLMRNVAPDVNGILVHDAMLAVYDRLMHEYTESVSRCYNHAPPTLRSGIDTYAGTLIHEYVFDNYRGLI